MGSPLYKLPPARSLAVFEDAGRTLNFSATARNLGVTQAAVSKRIQQLEQQWDLLLFVRSGRGLALTASGRKLHEAVSGGLTQIANAIEEALPRFEAGRVTITTTIALASVWLMPRLAKFRAEHPDIDIRLIATDEVLDLAGEGIDVGLRYGIAPWQGVQAQHLFDVSLFPVASQSYLATLQPLLQPSDIAAATLLHLDEPNSQDADWAVWFEATGVANFKPRGELRFNNYPLLVQAAVSGQGIALGWGYVIDDFLASGALVQCFPTSRRLEHAFFLVTPAEAQPRPEVEAFTNWIQRDVVQMRRDRRASANGGNACQ